MSLKPWLLGLVLFLSALAHGQNFDEVFSQGKVRPQYNEYWKIYSQLSDEKKRLFVRATLRDFSGDNALLALPRVLTYDENEVLRKGVDQRARAIQAFLKDHYSGIRSYASAKIVPELVVKGALDRSSENLVEAWRPEQFGFFYGPDVIRGANGQFYVVEDNPGFIGGMGDLIRARRSLAKNIPEYKELIAKTVSPSSFYDEICARFKDLAAEKQGIPLLLSYPKSETYDNEDARLRKLFAERGIESFQPREGNRSDTRLKILPSGVFLKKKMSNGKWSTEKVGHLILYYEPHGIDVLDLNNRRAYLKTLSDEILEDGELSQKLRSELEGILSANHGKWDSASLEQWLRHQGEDFLGRSLFTPTGYEGLWESVRNGKLSVTNGWGNEFVSDKGFYPYVEGLVKYYLREEPILKNIQTLTAAIYDADGKPELNAAALDQVKANPTEWVIKGATGRGGNEVFIGKKLSAEQLEPVYRWVEKNPEYFSFQKYTPLSIMDGHIVDIRALSVATPGKVIVSSVPWGRGTPESGTGKVNVSEFGRETTVLVEKPKSCSELLSLPGANLH